MSDQISRADSVHFYHKFLRGVSETQVLEAVTRVLRKDQIVAIQITDKNCVITVVDELAKLCILTHSINIKGKTIRVIDIDQTLTNVTIKDAPIQLSDEVIVAHMMKYGHILQGSVQRGLIRDTEILNGTRYLKIVNCVPTLPLTTTFGRFPVRLFADNGRTPCRYCNESDHPSYLCSNRLPKPKECFICKSVEHLQKDCPNQEKFEKFQKYGEYMYDIDEGNDSLNDTKSTAKLDTSEHDTPNPKRSKTDSENVDETKVPNNKQHNDDKQDKNSGTPPVPHEKPNDHMHVILGASNCNRIHIDRPNVIKAAVSGTTLGEVSKVIALASKYIDEFPGENTIDSVVLNLGTNDVTRCGKYVDTVRIAFAQAINNTKLEFPNTPIGVCSIIPRKGKGGKISALNESTIAANTYIQKVCEQDNQLTFIDMDIDFIRNGHPVRALYDSDDQSGVHVSAQGAQCLQKKMYEFFGLVQ